jgi:predicted dinucleotide-binding enzyme
MNIGIIGSGAVGRTIGAGLAHVGHTVMIGSRTPQSDALREWKSSAGPNARTGTLQETAAFGDVMIVATKYEGTHNALTLAGIDAFAGKVVIDTTNPISSPPTPEGLIGYSVGTTDSAAENIQRWLPAARVVKAFSVIGSRDMVNPSFPGGAPDMYICGNDAAAKQTVTALLRELGWTSVIDCGLIEAARAIEPLAILWCIYGFRTGGWRHGFRILTA